MSCGVGHRRGSDPVLLWLWHRLAATAQIQTLAWELPHATGVVLQRQKKKKQDDHLIMLQQLKGFTRDQIPVCSPLTLIILPTVLSWIF